MKIRNLQDSDYDDLFRLYQQQTSGLPFHHHVSREQFETDLLTTRFIRDPTDHYAEAKIALVAIENNEPCAFVSGGIVTNGDEVVPGETGYIQAIIARPSAAAAVKELIQRVTEHLRSFKPHKITVHDGCMCPVFFADSAGTLPSAWAWIGQCLLDVGFKVSGRLVRLVTRLDKPRGEVRAPTELRFVHVTHEMKGFDPQYDFGCLLMKPPYEYGDGVVWCGNFYAGVFVEGAAYKSLYMNYFAILDDTYRGKGLGRLVLQHCLYEAQQRGAEFVSLLTDFDNFIAQNLYRSEGFEVVDATHSFELKSEQSLAHPTNCV